MKTTNEIKKGARVIANIKLEAFSQAEFGDDYTITNGREEPIFVGDSGRVVAWNSDCSRVFVNWKSRNRMYGWADVVNLDVAETHEFENVTMYFRSEFLGVSTVVCKSLKVERAPYAQYKRATILTFKQPRQRKFRVHVLSYDQTIAIVDGKGIKFDNFGQAVASGEAMVSTGRRSCCDDGWNDDLHRHASAAGSVIYRQDKSGESSV